MAGPESGARNPWFVIISKIDSKKGKNRTPQKIYCEVNVMSEHLKVGEVKSTRQLAAMRHSKNVNRIHEDSLSFGDKGRCINTIGQTGRKSADPNGRRERGCGDFG